MKIVSVDPEIIGLQEISEKLKKKLTLADYTARGACMPRVLNEKNVNR